MQAKALELREDKYQMALTCHNLKITNEDYLNP
jgi:hypothetical protein